MTIRVRLLQLAVRIFGGADFGSMSAPVTPQQRQQIAPYLVKISG